MGEDRNRHLEHAAHILKGYALIFRVPYNCLMLQCEVPHTINVTYITDSIAKKHYHIKL